MHSPVEGETTSSNLVSPANFMFLHPCSSIVKSIRLTSESVQALNLPGVPVNALLYGYEGRRGCNPRVFGLARFDSLATHQLWVANFVGEVSGS